jgi:two-component system, cell cycle sensor histidine kinase and response regulator CckA
MTIVPTPKSQPGRKNLATTLAFAFFAFGLITLLTSATLQILSNFQAQRRAVFGSQKLLAQGAAGNVVDFVEQNFLVLESTAWLNDLSAPPAALQRKNLASLLGFQAPFKQLALLDEKGVLSAQASRLSREASTRFTRQLDRDLLLRIQEKKRYISPVYVDQVTSEPLVIMAVPIRKVLGGPGGALVAEVNLKFIWDLVDQLKVGKTGRAYVVDKSGNLLAFGDAARVLRGENVRGLQPVADFINKSASASVTDVTTYRGIAGHPVVGTYVALGSPDWAVVTELQLEEAFQPILRDGLISLGIVVVMAIFAGLCGIALARRMAVPLVNLTETAVRIAGGERELQAATDGPQEVASLAVAFNSMTSQLQQSLQELERQVQEVQLAEEQLHVTQFAVEKSADAVFLIGLDAGFLSVNEAACSSLGYTRDELLTMSVFDVDPAFPREHWSEHCAEMQAQSSVWIESFHRTKDGRLFPVELTANRVQFAGKVYHCAFVRDVTERKKAEQSLLRTQFSIDRAKEAIFWIGRDGKLFYFNEAACHSLGYSQEELHALTVFDIDPGFPVEHWEEHWQKSRELGSHIIETRHRAKDGRLFPVEVSIDYVSFAGEDYHCAYARDISERRQAEEEQQKLVSVVEMSRDFIGIATLDGRLTYLNIAALELVGLADLQDARTRSIFDFFPEENLAQAHGDMYTALMKQGSWRAESCFKNFATGALIDVELCAFVIKDAKGEPLCLATVTRDITERKLGQEHQVRLEEQLQHVQKLESVGRLAGGIAHDFNNMLTVILGYTELIRLRLSEEDPLLNEVAQIERAAGRSKDITQQLLAFSRKQIIKPRLVSLNDLVSGTQQALARLISEEIELSFLPEPDLWAANLDPSQVDQILVNLVVNARDAMPDGGKLIIETANQQIDEQFCRDHAGHVPGDFLLLTVSDSGIGMDKETVSHIFEPFFTTKEMDKGTGLGLATVYGIVRQNGGFITIYSEPGEGTSFRIFFPRAYGCEEPSDEQVQGPVSAGFGTILLVEDEDMVREAAIAMLEAIGYQVIVAETPMEAITLCEQAETRIDLLMTDVVMPGMKGTELRERLESIRPGIKTLYMSGYTSAVIVNQGVLDEGIHFIHKPFGMAELSLSVRLAME